MHDPLTQICQIRIPIPFMGAARKRYRGGWIEIADIWHKDPCADGSDDSCGWFMRAKHGDKKVLEKIVKRFEFDWDGVFKSDSGDSFFTGLFTPDGDPHLSTHGIVLNLFFLAAIEVFQSTGSTNWRRAKRFLNKHLLDILLFAENPTDSLADGITRKFEIGCGELHTAERRKERIKRMAACIYAWILRAERPWWRSPKLHVHHWRIVFPWLRNLNRLLFVRCHQCHRTLGWNKSVTSDWHGTRLTCYRCNPAQVNTAASTTPG